MTHSKGQETMMIKWEEGGKKNKKTHTPDPSCCVHYYMFSNLIGGVLRRNLADSSAGIHPCHNYFHKLLAPHLPTKNKDWYSPFHANQLQIPSKVSRVKSRDGQAISESSHGGLKVALVEVGI